MPTSKALGFRLSETAKEKTPEKHAAKPTIFVAQRWLKRQGNWVTVCLLFVTLVTTLTGYLWDIALQCKTRPQKVRIKGLQMGDWIDGSRVWVTPV